MLGLLTASTQKGGKGNDMNMVSCQEPDPYDEGKTQPGATLVVWFEEKAAN